MNINKLAIQTTKEQRKIEEENKSRYILIELFQINTQTYILFVNFINRLNNALLDV